jgi:copper chaperone
MSNQNESITQTFVVRGMTCGHCVGAVSQELASVPGVESVDVDLDSGVATVVSAGGVDAAAVRSAIDEAGYELVS